MKILITGPGAYLSESKDSPEVGKYYHMEDAAGGTQAQNRFFHLLVSEWEKSGCCSWDTDIKEHVKKSYGQGFDAYLYWNGSKLRKVKTREEIPEGIREDRDMCFGKLKSWSEYTLKQRRDCIDQLIRVMIVSGVNSKRFEEISEDFYDR